jgi:hypothetical protein
LYGFGENKPRQLTFSDLRCIRTLFKRLIDIYIWPTNQVATYRPASTENTMIEHLQLWYCQSYAVYNRAKLKMAVEVLLIARF